MSDNNRFIHFLSASPTRRRISKSEAVKLIHRDQEHDKTCFCRSSLAVGEFTGDGGGADGSCVVGEGSFDKAIFGVVDKCRAFDSRWLSMSELAASTC